MFTKGCLGTCWYGKYHYLEPWTGCSHGCLYCYARSRGNIKASLAELGTAFETPVPAFPADELPRRVLEEAAREKVSIVKLSRFTDILAPEHVRSGLSLAVLEALVRSPVERIIITTKGVPDERIVSLIGRNPAKFSYNAAVRPDTSLGLEPGLRPSGERLAAAAAVARTGALTTMHLDPMVPGFDDDPELLRPFLKGAKKKGLRRAMFSYLLLTDDIIAFLRQKLAGPALERVLAPFDMGRKRQMLPNQEDTVSILLRPEVRRRSVEAVAGLLRGLDFEFVLCSLKSAQAGSAPLCDGTFYA